MYTAKIEQIKEKIPTLVVFRNPKEKGSEEIEPMLENLRAKFGSKVEIVEIDTSKNGEYKVHYKLTEYPTYILYREGRELMRESGKKTEAKLEDMLDRTLG